MTKIYVKRLQPSTQITPRCEIKTFDNGMHRSYSFPMARPKTGEEKRAFARIAVRIASGLRAELDALAVRNGRSLTDEVKKALENYVKTRRTVRD
jgi:predicted HicB family RNase H-like nuclease